ncbi:sulfatase [Maribacter polysaccharolyticus]|uniref:sulfatase family protein n=1 Tax=Maribacter polysaccharolyticus TaxID=3020831 RepID=UPI00237F2DDF|nr:sulfatase [Maribacter polysaccharolyticus]MDE3741797.1 sulfatase [Maribacter polysaccharolyticus]
MKNAHLNLPATKVKWNLIIVMLKKLYIVIAILVSASSAYAQTKPNIIWLMAEDISLDLECYGTKAVKTPHLNKMAANGVRFDNCFVTNPICSPSRSAMMVGTHQLKINADNHRSNRDVPLNEKYKPFTYWLRRSGYTCILGHHGVMGKGRKTDVNFKSEKIGKWDGKENFGLFDKVDHFEKEDQPFFMQIQLDATHRGDWWNAVRAASKHPVNPDEVELPEYIADHPVTRLDWAKYLDQVEYIDDEVGMIFQELEDKGMADNTIVIFIGDNGRCNIRGKGYLHDSGLHIPLIIYNPKNSEVNKVRKDVVGATDITATILDFAGVEIPEYMTGKPIFDEDFSREFVYASRSLWDEVEEKSRAITSGTWKYIRNDKPEIPFDAHQAYLEFYRPAVHIMRTLKNENKLSENQGFFFENSKPKEELYDLKADPMELNNLADNLKYSKVLERMKKNTQDFDAQMKPKDSIYFPTHAISVEVLKWVKKERPVLYQKMLLGEEIGFSGLNKEFKIYKSQKK